MDLCRRPSPPHPHRPPAHAGRGADGDAPRRRRARRRLRLHAQGPADGADRDAVPRRRAARPHRRAAGPRCSATPTCTWRALIAATSCARGRVVRFRGDLQAELTSIARVAPRHGRPRRVPARRLPRPGRARRLPRRARGRGPQAGSARCSRGCSATTSCARRCAARPRTRAQHHAYLGGLLEHTVAVATLAVEACTLHQRLDQDLLLTAALVHDLGRIRELTLGAEIGLSDEGRLLGHVELGLRMVEQAAARPGSTRRAGSRSATACSAPRRRRAPGRRFALPEALALYRLNALDAGVKAAIEHGMGHDAPAPEGR